VRQQEATIKAGRNNSLVRLQESYLRCQKDSDGVGLRLTLRLCLFNQSAAPASRMLWKQPKLSLQRGSHLLTHFHFIYPSFVNSHAASAASQTRCAVVAMPGVQSGHAQQSWYSARTGAATVLHHHTTKTARQCAPNPCANAICS
jgi:hypothetical protein